MPLMAWVMEPPRPSQNVFWCSFSLTRSGSSAFSPAIERLQQGQGGSDQVVAGEYAAAADQAFVGITAMSV